jgi:hypothetical protein
MGVVRSLSGLVAMTLLLGFTVTAEAARAQTPAPLTRADENASIVKPLVEIGRVRSRTPYCAALAKARPGIDAAIAYEYAVPVVAQDLRSFRLDSHLTKYQSMKRSERDLSALWSIAKEGRAEVRALREAANAPGVDEARKKELLAFADALDGAKERQMWLAKAMARNLAVLSEAPVRDIANSSSDDHSANAFTTRIATSSVAIGATPAPAYTQTQSDAIEDHQRLQGLFDTFSAEQPIRDDLKVASQHAVLAMQLGGCTSL